MQLTNKYKKGFKFILCVIDLFSKYAWVVSLKDKKSAAIVNAFESILNDSGKKSNKIWVDQGTEFYNKPFKTWLEENDTEMYSTHNVGESVVSERLIRTLNHKIYSHMTVVSKNIYFDVLDDILYHGHTLFAMTRVKKLMDHSMKKNCRKQIKQNLELKKLSREKKISYTSNREAMTIRLIAAWIKTDVM